jgi:heme/copper-type cytochrome/quinol oxidase subunit 2
MDHYNSLEGRTFKVLGYLSSLTNLLACAIMLLVLRHVRRITKQPIDLIPEHMTSSVSEACRINTLVTSFHITLIVAYTLLSFLADNVYVNKQETTSFRISSLWYCLAAILDIFVAYMMFFIFDEASQTPDIIRDESLKISYPVIQVVKQL